MTEPRGGDVAAYYASCVEADRLARSVGADAYFHVPDELREELESGRLVVDVVDGVEGPGVLLSDIDRRWWEETPGPHCWMRLEMRRPARISES